MAIDYGEFAPAEIEWPNKPFADYQKLDSLEQLIEFCNKRPAVPHVLDFVQFYLEDGQEYRTFRVPTQKVYMCDLTPITDASIRWLGNCILVSGKVESWQSLMRILQQ